MKNINMELDIKSLGKWRGTTCFGNSFWVKRYEKGVALRKRRQAQIIISLHEAIDFARSVKEIANLWSDRQLDWIWYKYPETKEFIERMKVRDVDYAEIKEAKKLLDLKEKMVEELEDA